MTNPKHTDTSRSGDPVALMHQHPDHCGCEFEEYRHGAGCLTDDDIANGWIETRLYSADRIEALEARVAELEDVAGDLLTRFEPWSPHDHDAAKRARAALGKKQ